ncbi:hypothetical protein PACTADRAFT_31012 [Pachysolen tannophilus NRRL Y-2460]|uniref:IPT/TIG domain-containing protein n=1 Tax=Pachysolen tannophilus NRRL Y-2460 TaxID=669874 RepID=A0A1E4U0N9_PACTA|nr:hypothetical protein PACTADRAFT_31012 [Pachysolen tannophilus NRRL Y-2460]
MSLDEDSRFGNNILPNFNDELLISNTEHNSNDEEDEYLLNEFLDGKLYEHSTTSPPLSDSTQPAMVVDSCHNGEISADDKNKKSDNIFDQFLSQDLNTQNHDNNRNSAGINTVVGSGQEYFFQVNGSNDSNNSVGPTTPPDLGDIAAVDGNDAFHLFKHEMMDLDFMSSGNNNGNGNGNGNGKEKQDQGVMYEQSQEQQMQMAVAAQQQQQAAAAQTLPASSFSEFQNYELSRQELMKLKFGCPKDLSHLQSFTLPQNNNIIDTENDDSNDQLQSQQQQQQQQQQDSLQIPQEYYDSTNDDELPYKLKISGLPDYSRVETQIKVSLSISPAPPQFLLHLPSDTISKTKYLLKEEVPDSAKSQILYLDTYVVTSGETGGNKRSKAKQHLQSPNDSESLTREEGQVRLIETMKNCNICNRCIRRELKRASRRKNGSLEDGFNWNLVAPKRAVIFNCKEIISFPPPTGATGTFQSQNIIDTNEYCDDLLSKNYLNDSNTLMMEEQIQNENNNNNNNDINRSHMMVSEKKIDIMSRIICYCRHHHETKGFRLFFVLKDHQDKILGKTFSKPIMIMDKKKSTAEKANTSSTNNVRENSEYSMANSPQSTSSTISAVKKVKKEHPLSPASLEESSSEHQTSSSESFNRPSKRKRPSSPTDSVPGSNNSNNINTNISGSHSIPPTSYNYFESVTQQRCIKRDPISPMSSSSDHQRSPRGFNTSLAVIGSSERETSVTSITSTSGSNNNLSHKQQLPIVPQQPVSSLPSIQRIIPAQGPIRGGVEVTLLGSNFRPGLVVKFGSNRALATHCWSDSTIVTYLPPASQAGQVLVNFDNITNEELANNTVSAPQQIFTYNDDTDRQLIELALQIVGLKMNGKLEDAKNIAKRIIGNSESEGGSNSGPSSMGSISNGDTGNQMNDSINHEEWISHATETVKEVSNSSLNPEEMLLKFLSLLDMPNSPITSPNWAIVTMEGQTLLHLSCMKNYFKLVLFLINRGSRIDYKDVNDLTPLHFALLCGNREVIEVLLKCGANMNTKITNNISIIDICDSNVLDLVDEYLGSSSEDYDEEIDSNDSFSTSVAKRAGIKARRSNLHRKYSNESVNSISSMFNIDDSLRHHISRMVTDSLSGPTDLNSDNVTTASGIEASCSTGTVDEGNFSSDFADESGASIEEDDFESDYEFESDGEVNDMELNNVANENIGQGNPVTRGDNTKKTRDNDAEVDADADLPNYEDLFPRGSASLKSLFKSFSGNYNSKQVEEISSVEDEDSAPSSSSQQLQETSKENEDKVFKFFVNNSTRTTPLMRDKMLFFFWLPLLLIALILLLNNDIVEESFNKYIDFARYGLGNLMLGRDRVEGMIESVNAAVTAGLGGINHNVNRVNRVNT